MNKELEQKAMEKAAAILARLKIEADFVLPLDHTQTPEEIRAHTIAFVEMVDAINGNLKRQGLMLSASDDCLFITPLNGYWELSRQVEEEKSTYQ